LRHAERSECDKAADRSDFLRKTLRKILPKL